MNVSKFKIDAEGKQTVTIKHKHEEEKSIEYYWQNFELDPRLTKKNGKFEEYEGFDFKQIKGIKTK